MPRPVCRWSLLALGCYALAGCAAGGSAGPALGSSPRRATVNRGDLAREVLLTGELVAEEATALAAPSVNVWPLQVRWLVEDGTAVQAGDPVVEVDPSRLLSNLEELRLSVYEAASRLTTREATAASAVAEARFAVEKARARLDTARIDAAVPTSMLPAQEVEERRLEQRRAELALAEAEFKLANRTEAGRAEVDLERVTLDRARAEVARAETGIAMLTLRAPRGGIAVIARNPRENRTLKVGDTVWPGLVLARLPEMGSLLVEARLFDVDDGLVDPGMPVEATLDAFPGAPVAGQVRSVDPFAQEVGSRSQRRFFRVVVDLDLVRVDTSRLLPGMSVKVAVHPPPLRDVLQVPRDCLEWEKGVARAALADGRRVEVTVGPCSSTLCALASGLDEGTALRPAGGNR